MSIILALRTLWHVPCNLIDIKIIDTNFWDDVHRFSGLFPKL